MWRILLAAVSLVTVAGAQESGTTTALGVDELKQMAARFALSPMLSVDPD